MLDLVADDIINMAATSHADLNVELARLLADSGLNQQQQRDLLRQVIIEQPTSAAQEQLLGNVNGLLQKIHSSVPKKNLDLFSNTISLRTDLQLTQLCNNTLLLATALAPRKVSATHAILDRAEEVAEKLHLDPAATLELTRRFATTSNPAVLAFLMTVSIRAFHPALETACAPAFVAEQVSTPTSTPRRGRHGVGSTSSASILALQTLIGQLWTLLANFRLIRSMLDHGLQNEEKVKIEECFAALLALFVSSHIALTAIGGHVDEKSALALSFTHLSNWADHSVPVLRSALLQEFALHQLPTTRLSRMHHENDLNQENHFTAVLTDTVVFVCKKQQQTPSHSTLESLQRVQFFVWMKQLPQPLFSKFAFPEPPFIPSSHLEWIAEQSRVAKTEVFSLTLDQLDGLVESSQRVSRKRARANDDD